MAYEEPMPISLNFRRYYHVFTTTVRMVISILMTLRLRMPIHAEHVATGKGQLTDQDWREDGEYETERHRMHGRNYRRALLEYAAIPELRDQGRKRGSSATYSRRENILRNARNCRNLPVYQHQRTESIGSIVTGTAHPRPRSIGPLVRSCQQANNFPSTVHMPETLESNAETLR